MLEGEMDGHLGYEKHEHSGQGNSRNGYTSKKIHGDDVIARQNRPLDNVYLIVWMDGIFFKVRENSKVVNKTIYLAVGLNRDGYKEVLGMWLGKKKVPVFV